MAVTGQIVVDEEESDDEGSLPGDTSQRGSSITSLDSWDSDEDLPPPETPPPFWHVTFSVYLTMVDGAILKLA